MEPGFLENSKDSNVGLNTFEARSARVEIPGRITVELQAPNYVSYSHFHNQERVSPVHKLQASAQLHSPAQNGDYTLEVRLMCQGQVVGETSFVTLKSSDFEGMTTPVPYRLHGDFLFEVREATPATFEIRVLDGSDALASATLSTQIFPPNLWAIGGEGGEAAAGLLLSTFVRPLDPSLDELLTKAREVKSTYVRPDGSKFSPSTLGYQGNSAELMEDVKSIYEAVQRSQIQYSNPASSLDWAQSQLIRTSEEILNSRVATCLDSTVFFASLLENIGVYPLIALVPGHAFVGFWTRDGIAGSLGLAFQAEAAVAQTKREQPLMHWVETTLMCVSAEMVDFESAMKIAEQKLTSSLIQNQLSNNPDEEWVIIDVAAARSRGYRPLPARVKAADGTVSILEYTIEQSAPIDFSISVDVAQVGAVRDESPARVRLWKSQMLDLTFNNPLLNMRRRRAQQLQLIIPNGRLGKVEDFLQQGSAELKLKPALEARGTEGVPFGTQADGSVQAGFEELAESVFTQEKALHYVGPSPKGHSLETYERAAANKVRNLAKSAKNSIDETGLNNLYMTFGSLRWKRKEASTSKDDYIVSPLILLPVKLRSISKTSWAVSLDDSTDLATNETLAMKLFTEYGISIPALTQVSEDEAGIDIPALLSAVRTAITAAKQTDWLVAEDSSIGTYDFSTFHMWKDLNDNWAKMSKSPLVNHFINSDGVQPFEDPNASDLEITEDDLAKELAKVPVPADGTQLRAVLRSLRGESFIIQGPPGTGKSQTITNLLARNLQAGKRVLFMSEKPAALEVVKDRLDEIGLGTFVLDLHSKNTSPEAIRNQLSAALDASQYEDQAGIESALFDFGVAAESLAKYPERLHREDEEFHQSVYKVRDAFLTLPAGPSMILSRSSLKYFVGENLTSFKSQLQNMQDIAQQAGTAQTNLWSLSLLTKPLESEKRDALAANVQSLFRALDSLEGEQTAALLQGVDSLAAVRDVAGLPSNLPSGQELESLIQPQRAGELAGLKNKVEALVGVLSNGSLTKPNFGALPIADLEAELKSANEAKLFRKKKLETLAAKLGGYWAGEVNQDNIATAMTQVRRVYDAGQTVIEDSSRFDWLAAIPGEKVFDFESVMKHLNELGELKAFADLYGNQQQSRIGRVMRLSSAERDSLFPIVRTLENITEQLETTDESFRLWLGDKDLLSKLRSVRDKWTQDASDNRFNSISRWGDLLAILEPLKLAEQHAAYSQVVSGELGPEDVARAFERSHLSLLLDKLIDEHELENFNSGIQNANIDKLQRSVQELRKHNKDTIASSVISARTFDPRVAVGKAGSLRTEINRTTRKLPIRQLMKRYWETITEITPCVAASPDSVARFLDIDLANFDLVVFDEASQLRVPNSIGALGRGKAAIIVGDGKQMPPTSFFATSSNEDEDDLNSGEGPDVVDEESVLSMAQYSKLPRVMLDWHYRSQDEALIAFSNAAYYEGRLASFPSPRADSAVQKVSDDDASQAIADAENLEFDNGRAIQLKLIRNADYIRGKKRKAESPTATALGEATTEDEEVEEQAYVTQGTNLTEANAVVDKIIALHKQYGEALNLGVVTMNENQRKLISELLDQRASDELRKLADAKMTRENIFVRPLERVQGDERDIILMSIGFAREADPRSPSGFKLHQNFGPLIKTGSERRLNVAITRARRAVWVYCSFEPSDLRVDDGSSDGMKHLKEYLNLALYGPERVGLANQAGFEAPDRHRIQVAKKIEGLGYNVKQSVGLSNFKVDIAVEHPNRPGEYILAILLDGPSWRKRPAVYDRDVLPVGVLKGNMGWPAVERIWFPDWLTDEQGELSRIQSRVQQLETAEPERAAPVIEHSQPRVDVDRQPIAQLVEPPATGSIQATPKTLGIPIDDIEPFGNAGVGKVTDDKSLLQYTNHPEIVRVIGELTAFLTKIEGPVHPDRAVSYIAKCFGLSHVQSARYEEILKAIPRAKFSRDPEGFIFPENLTPTSYVTWKRRNLGEPRDIATISLTEIGNAMKDLCDRTHGIEREELVRQTMLVFGPKTLSAPIRKRLEAAIDFAVQRNQLKLDGDHYVPGL